MMKASVNHRLDITRQPEHKENGTKKHQINHSQNDLSGIFNAKYTVKVLYTVMNVQHNLVGKQR